MSLVIETVSDSTQAKRDLEALRKSVAGIETATAGVTESFRKMAVGVGTALAAFGTLSALTKFSDGFVSLENRIKAVTDTQLQFNRALEGVKDIAIRSRSGLQETASLYSRIAINAREIGINQADTLRVTAAVSKSMKLAGATAAESTSAMLQFGQAIGAGTLQGDELRSLLENAPVLAKALAKEFKVSVGELKDLGEKGQLVSGKVLKAILNQADDINTRFEKMGVTFEGAFSNLGTSVSLLVDSATKAILGSEGFGLAKYINNLAIGIKNVADNFSFYLLRIKTSILFFVVDAKAFFTSLWPVLLETGEYIGSVARNLYDQWAPSFSETFILVSNWATSVSATVAQAFEELSKTSLFKSLYSTVASGLNYLKTLITSAFSTFNIELPSIDVNSVFKGFEPALEILGSWVKKAERLFFWLYDEVIGHSWIPDLVLETGSWLKKLLADPLSFIKAFASKASGLFEKLSKLSPFKPITEGATTVNKTLEKTSNLLGGLLVASKKVSAVSFMSSVSPQFVPATPDFDAAELNKFEPSKYKVKEDPLQIERSRDINYKDDSFFTKFKDAVDTSVFGRTFKQVFGMRDNTPGTVFGTPIDTRPQAQVGRGPMRTQEARPFGHDVINALPKDWQIPLLAGLTGVMGLAVVKTFESGPVRSVLLSALTTAFGLAVAQNVDDSVIKRTTAKISYTFLDLVGRGMDVLFSGNALKDPLGTLSLLAKTSLLFKEGRDAALAVTKALVSAPTKLALGMNEMGLRAVTRAGISRADTQLAELPTKLQTAVKTANEAFGKSLTQLANIKDNSGQAIGALRANVLVQKGQLDTLTSSTAAAKALQVAIAANNKVGEKEAALRNIADKEAEISKARAVLVEREKAISDKLKEAAESFKEGFKNISAAVGGTLGGLAGYQIGSAITRAMGDDVSNWQKVAITLTSSIVGQGLGAALGAGIASAVIAVTGLVTSAIAAAFTVAPFIAGGVVIAGALYAGYLLFRGLPEEWKKALYDFDIFGTKSAAEATGLRATPARQKEIDSAISNGTAYDISTSEKLAEAQKKAFADISKQAKDQTAAFFDNLRSQDILQIGKGIDSLSDAIKSVGRWFSGTPAGYATGGSIYGPGTGTSDSIPAMLSNGEFVVNAKAAARNRRILEAINAGKPTSFFASGGSVSDVRYSAISGTPYGPNNPLDVRDTSLQGKLSGAFDDIKKAAVNKDGKFDFDALLSAIKGLAGKAADSVANEGDKKPPAPPRPVDTRSSFRRVLEGKAPNEAIAAALQSSGVAGISSQNVSDLSTEFKSMIAESLDNIAKAKDRLKTENSPFLREQLNDNISEQIGVVNGLLRKASAAGGLPSNFKESSKGKEAKTKDAVFGEQLKIINETFPELGLSLKEFIELTDDSRNRLTKSALDIYKETARINELPIGVKAKGSKIINGVDLPDEATAALAKNEANRVEAQKLAIEQQRKSRSLFQNVGKLFQELNIGLNELQVNSLLDEDAKAIEKIALEIKEANVQQSKIKDEPAERIRINEVIKEKTDSLLEAVPAALIRAAKGFDVVQVLGARVSIPVERAAFNRMSTMEAEALKGYLQGVQAGEAEAKTGTTDEIRKAAQKSADIARKKANEAIENAAARLNKFEEASALATKLGISIERSFFNSLSNLEQDAFQELLGELDQGTRRADNEQLSEAVRQKEQERVNQLNDAIKRGIEGKSREIGKDVGKAFASKLKEDFTSAFGGALRGQKDENRTVLLTMYDNLLDGLTNNILDTFSKSVSDKLLGENSPAFKVLTDVGQSFADKAISFLGIKTAQADPKAAGGVVTESSTTALTETLTGAWASLKDTLSTSWTDLSSVLGGSWSDLSSFLSEGLSSIMGWFSGSGGGGSLMDSVTALFLADGGHVSGPGTSRSDSIPAMLSNGEFVVNASATRRNLSLLHALNSGGLPKFADGGLVTPVNIAKIEPVGNSSKGSTTAVFHLNITGDVSNQTRAEIQKMIPQIASGINAHNYEMGSRRR